MKVQYSDFESYIWEIPVAFEQPRIPLEADNPLMQNPAKNIRFGQWERGGWCWAGATFCWRTMNLCRVLSSPWGRMFHDHFSVHSIISTAVENLWKARIYVFQNIYIYIYIWTSVFEKQEYMFSRNKQSIFVVLQLSHYIFY